MVVGLRLRSQNDPQKTLGISGAAWFDILDLAEVYGWNPMGTLLPEWYEASPLPVGHDRFEPVGWQGNYTPGEGGLVVFEDALNLADALEQAFLEYEPVRVALERNGNGYLMPSNGKHYGIGALLELVDFCRSGAFWIEEFC